MKKKILTLIVITLLGFSSCKKEELAQPSSNFPAQKVADKSNAGGWD